MKKINFYTIQGFAFTTLAVLLIFDRDESWEFAVIMAMLNYIMSELKNQRKES